MEQSDLKKIYAQRFNTLSDNRRLLWQTLCRYYFQRFIKPTDTLLDLGAGYCEFINAINCKKKIAVDLNPATRTQAAHNVQVVHCSADQLPSHLNNKIDTVFASNFFEHLPNREIMLATLKAINRVLKPQGQLIILQPNIRLVKEAYWDFFDHSLPLTEKSLQEALELTGFHVDYQKIRFLPYTTISKLPINPLFIKLYLKSSVAQYFCGKQTFMVAQTIKK